MGLTAARPTPDASELGQTGADLARDYHRRSQHTRQGYAAGPGAVDWDAQPDPFRRWRGTRRYDLPRTLTAPGIAWSGLAAARPPAPLDLASLSTLLRLTAGITAWKSDGAARWALRVHPSSGNLHPTETWVIANWVAGLPDGLYHYQALDHSLEWRASALDAAEHPGLWLGFSSVHWREAWKYGERAFRYCQLDLGHVLAALAHACALLGWRPRHLALPSAALAHSLGLDRAEDYAAVEPEEAQVLVHVQGAEALPQWDEWSGLPSLLDSARKHAWPHIDAVAAATRGPPPSPLGHPPAQPEVDGSTGVASATEPPALQVILGRRSARGFDARCLMPLADLRRILRALLPGGAPTWDLWPHAPRVHPLLLVHRVAGLRPGLYALPRSPAAREALVSALRAQFEWLAVDDELPLYRLVAARSERIAQTLACHQDIAAHSAFTLLFVAEFAGPLSASPAAYRHLHWEAGMLGHSATLAAEALGWRGTGIGCFFDDLAHEILGLTDERYRVLYLYAIGLAREDAGLLTQPAYA